MTNQNIKIHDEAIINATGKYNSKHCKAVICKETGDVYTSVMDAAKAAGCHYSMMNGHLRGKFKYAKGKHYQYLSEALDNPDSVFAQLRKMSEVAEAATKEAAENAEKARLWDELQARLKAEAEAEAKRQEEERLAEEKRQKKIAKLKKKIEYDTRIRDNCEARLDAANFRLANDYAELEALEGITDDDA